MKSFKINKLHWFCVFAVCCCFTNITAQNPNDSIAQMHHNWRNYGYRMLYGNGERIDYQKATDIFIYLAQQGDAEAYNVLGMMYKYGIGFTQNDRQAYSMFAIAAELGFAKSLYNIGLMYKFGHFVEQNLDSMQVYFHKAKNAGYDYTDYVDGYTAYKGQGTEQDYSEAFSYFVSGAAKNNPESMYMSGLCYLYGRGVAQNIAQGKYWIEQAAIHGAKFALDFMVEHKNQFGSQSNAPMHTPAPEREKLPIETLIPERFTKKTNLVKDTKIAGLWEGKLITYDWSGCEIDKETSVKLFIDAFDGQISGVWTENDTANTVITATLNSAGWMFDNVILYSGEFPMELKTADFVRDTIDGQEYMHGNVSFYCERTREYSEPKYLILKHIQNVPTSVEKTDQLPHSALKNVNVSPNPFNDEIHIEFSLPKAETLRFVIYSAQGRQMYISNLKACAEGYNSHTIRASHLPAGAYTLQIVGNITRYSVKLLK
jgi:TPR repeat protein